MICYFFFKQKTAYELRISDWSSDVCSSDLPGLKRPPPLLGAPLATGATGAYAAHTTCGEGVPSMATSSARSRFLTPAEVAEELRVSAMTVYRLIKAGELRAARIGKSYRIRADNVDEIGRGPCRERGCQYV